GPRGAFQPQRPAAGLISIATLLDVGLRGLHSLQDRLRCVEGHEPLGSCQQLLAEAGGRLSMPEPTRGGARRAGTWTPTARAPRAASATAARGIGRGSALSERRRMT